jgi:hypothetical protein
VWRKFLKHIPTPGLGAEGSPGVRVLERRLPLASRGWLGSAPPGNIFVLVSSSCEYLEISWYEWLGTHGTGFVDN